MTGFVFSTHANAVVLLVLLAGRVDAGAETQPSGPAFKEVYDLVQTHLSGLSGSDLNRTAVQALVSALAPRVAIATREPGGDSGAHGSLVARSTLFDPGLAYIRVAEVRDGLAKSISDSLQQLRTTNQLNGVVLDLRFAEGEDYAAAAAAADLFVKKDIPLLDWGQGAVRSKPAPDALTVPIVALMNRQTSGAAEALAAVLREASVALLLGARTAGQAMTWQEYPLQDGSRLRIASAPVLLGDGTALSTDGVKPDIAVEVSPQAERAYFTNAFEEPTNLNSASTNSSAQGKQTNLTARARRPRFNEAELVRARREGFNVDLDTVPAEPAISDQPVIRDPVLVRALDVLKGLALVRRSRP